MKESFEIFGRVIAVTNNTIWGTDIFVLTLENLIYFTVCNTVERKIFFSYL